MAAAKGGGMVKTRGLGRGLDALLGEDDRHAGDREMMTLPLHEMRPGKCQPRQKMDDRSLEELADSIREHGVLQPILIRPAQSGSGYEIIAGERRWRAAALAGVHTIPVLVREMNDVDTMAVALIENLQRENLNVLEEALGLQRLIGEFGLTHDEAARAVGKSRSAVSNLLRLLDLSESVRSLLMDEVLDMGHARALLPLSATQQHEVALEIVDKRWSVRQAEQRVKVLLNSQVAKATPNESVDRMKEQAQQWEGWLSQRLNVGVNVKTNRQGAGTLSIRFANQQELQGLMEKIGRDQLT